MDNHFDRPHEEYSTLNDAFIAGLERLVRLGWPAAPRDLATVELAGQSFRLSNPRARLITLKRRKWSLNYALGDLMWHLAGSTSLDFIAAYSKKWRRYSDDGRTIAGSCYGHKIFVEHNEPSLWRKAINLLLHDRDTRRCIIPLFQPSDLGAATDSRDIPCCIFLQFLVRQGRLCLINFMRSNDIMFGFGYDVFLFTVLQEIMSLELGLELGWYQHNVGSLHLYARDAEWASQILAESGSQHESEMRSLARVDELPTVLRFEEKIRHGELREAGWAVHDCWAQMLDALLCLRMIKNCDQDAVVAAAQRLTGSTYEPFISRAMQVLKEGESH